MYFSFVYKLEVCGFMWGTEIWKEKKKKKKEGRRRHEREGTNEEVFLICSVISSGERISAWLDYRYGILF